MRIAVLGATGGIGRHIVTQALHDGHTVTAAVRDPARLGLNHPRLTVARADALDPASLKDVVAGTDAVLSGIGAAGRRDPLKPASASARAAAEAMAATGTRRVLVVSAGPLNRTGAGQSFAAHRVWRPLLWRILRDTYSDLEVMERVLRDSGLEWTAVRPPRLTDRPGTGRYRYEVDAGPRGTSVPRADVARAMLDFIGVAETVARPVGVSA
ncbi:NAD(P)-dependent oxidoreductase [Spirillospora sp. CA-294931]|uniref:NAD(P)-dependent oxidoreductase n=1 Tax=Spirillospora sp. CA-294931 TaxID=3240042 RepID=UPI003D94DC38